MEFLDIQKNEISNSKSNSIDLGDINDMKGKSEDVSLGHLDILINKKKVQQPPATEVSVDKIKSASVSSKSKSSKKNNIVSESSRSRSRSISISVSNSGIKREKMSKRVQRENADPYIYQKKFTLLNKLDNLYAKGHWKHYVTMTTNNLLQDIQNEYNIKSREANTKGSLKQMRLILLCVILGMEFCYGQFDNTIEGWTRSAIVNVENGEFDDDLEEIAEKWFGGESQLPVELRLLRAIGLSGLMFVLSKRLTDPTGGANSPLAGILSSFFGGGGLDSSGFGDLINKMSPPANLRQQQQQQQQQGVSQPPQFYKQFEQHAPPPVQDDFRNFSPQQAAARLDSSEEDLQPSKIQATEYNDAEIDKMMQKMQQSRQVLPEPESIDLEIGNESKVISPPQKKRQYKKRQQKVK